MSASDALSSRQFGPWTVQHQGRHPYGGEFATVHDASGEQVGHMRFLPGDNRFTLAPGHTTVEYVHVDETHRGQGAARALYQAVHEQTGAPFIHSRDEMTPAAKKAVASLAAEDPDAHRVVTWRGGTRSVRAYPRKSQR